MEPMRLFASDIAYLAPELTLVIAAVVLSVIDLLMPRQVSRRFLGWLSIAGVLVAGLFVLMQLGIEDPIILLNESYRVDDFANVFKLVFLGATAIVLLMSVGRTEDEGIEHEGEYYYLFLPATIGAMIMASSGDLITLFVGLELLSITSYVLVAFRKKSVKSGEGAFKYLVMGAIASAFILYGMSFLYGMSGSTNLGEIRNALSTQFGSFEALVYVSFFLMLAGFAFKIAAAPFHTWAPDAYQGAPTQVTAYLAVVSKAAGLAIIFRVMQNLFYGVGHADKPLYADMFLALAVLAAVAMIVGNTAALRQKNMKRLLAFSGVANAGYLLVPLAEPFTELHADKYSELMYYLIAYVIMNLGMFAVISVVARAEGHEEMKGFAGLYYRAPWTAVGAVVLLLSLAGFPVTAGFFGKLFIMLGALFAGKVWLATVIIVTSVMSFYYYFSIMRQMFMRSHGGGADIRVPATHGIVIWGCAVASLALGIVPRWVIDSIGSVFSLYDFFIQ